MTDYTLKFTTEAAANKVLFDGEQSRFPEHVIDIIGTIYKDTGAVATYNGVASPIMAATPGWHVNVRGPETDAFNAYIVEVATPLRVWA